MPPRSRPFMQCDVFSTVPTGGNGLAVVLDGTEAKTGILDPLGSDLEPGPGMYPQLMRDLANALAECL